MIIRKATPSDASSIQRLLVQLGYPDLSENDVVEKIKLYNQAGYCMLVAENEKKVVGFISLHWFDLVHWKGKLGRITSFCIDEKFRSKGVGQQLLQACEKLLLNEGCAKIEVTSNVRRTRAHTFYLKSGYVEDSKRFVKLSAQQTIKI